MVYPGCYSRYLLVILQYFILVSWGLSTSDLLVIVRYVCVCVCVCMCVIFLGNNLSMTVQNNLQSLKKIICKVY